jgi:hypothetical protein
MDFEKKQNKRDIYWKKYRKELWSIHFPIWCAWMLFLISTITGYGFKMVWIIMFFVVSGLFSWKLLRMIAKLG